MAVHEYWFVDPDRDLIRVYRLTTDRFARPVELSAERDDTLTTALVPGVQVSLRKLFRR
jgi:Uma2 family endonuclease